MIYDITDCWFAFKDYLTCQDEVSRVKYNQFGKVFGLFINEDGSFVNKNKVVNERLHTLCHSLEKSVSAYNFLRKLDGPYIEGQQEIMIEIGGKLNEVDHHKGNLEKSYLELIRSLFYKVHHDNNKAFFLEEFEQSP